MKKRILSALCAVMLLTLLCTGAYAVAQPTEDFYVADYAGVLSDELEQRISDYNGALEQQCGGAQFVVLTVNYLDGMYSDEYAAQVFAEWGIGDAENNNGVLLLLAVQENKFWLMSGYGIQRSFDPQVDNILDASFEKHFDSGEYDEAVSGVLSDVLAWFDKYYGAETAESGDYADYSYTPAQDENFVYSQSSGYSRRSSKTVIVVVILLLYLLLRSSGRSNRGGRGGGNGGGGGGFWPWFFIGSSFGRRYDPPPGGHHPPPPGGGYHGGSGGFGGGSHHGGGGFGGGHSGGFGGGGHHGGGGFGGGGGGGRR